MVKLKVDAHTRSSADWRQWKHVDYLNFPVWIKLPLPWFLGQDDLTFRIVCTKFIKSCRKLHFTSHSIQFPLYILFSSVFFQIFLFLLFPLFIFSPKLHHLISSLPPSRGYVPLNTPCPPPPPSILCALVYLWWHFGDISSLSSSILVLTCFPLYGGVGGGAVSKYCNKTLCVPSALAMDVVT